MKLRCKLTFLGWLLASTPIFAQIEPVLGEVFIQELYFECPENNTPELQVRYKDILSRYLWTYDPEMDPQLVTGNLTEFPLKNKCNSQLLPDYETTSFQSPINPLKYFIPFDESFTQVIQVGSSNYYLIIYAK